MQRKLIITLITLIFLMMHIQAMSEPLDDYLFVYSDGIQFGYSDFYGELVLLPHWDAANPFKHDIAIVGIKDLNGDVLYGIIDNKGTYIVEPVWEGILENRYLYGMGSYYYMYAENIIGIYDIEKRQLVMLSNCTDAHIVQSGQLIAAKDSVSQQWGYYNEEGQMVIPAKYEEARGFVNDYGFVELYDEESKLLYHGLINSHDEWIPMPDGLEAYSDVIDGFFEIRTLGNEVHYGLMNIDGSIIVKPQYDNLWLDGEYIIIKSNNLYGLMNVNGSIIIKPQYDYLSLERNYVIVEHNKRFGCITYDGETIIPEIFDDVCPREEYIDVKYSGHTYIISINERLIMPQE